MHIFLQYNVVCHCHGGKIINCFLYIYNSNHYLRYDLFYNSHNFTKSQRWNLFTSYFVLNFHLNNLISNFAMINTYSVIIINFLALNFPSNFQKSQILKYKLLMKHLHTIFNIKH